MLGYEDIIRQKSIAEQQNDVRKVLKNRQATRFPEYRVKNPLCSCMRNGKRFECMLCRVTNSVDPQAICIFCQEENSIFIVKSP